MITVSIWSTRNRPSISRKSTGYEDFYACPTGHFEKHTECDNSKSNVIDIGVLADKSRPYSAPTVHSSISFCPGALGSTIDMIKLLAYVYNGTLYDSVRAWHSFNDKSLPVWVNWVWVEQDALFDKSAFLQLLESEVDDPRLGYCKALTRTNWETRSGRQSLIDATKELRYRGGVEYYDKIYDAIMYGEL